MKRIISFALVLAMMLAIMPLTVFATGTDGLVYELSEDGTYYIVSDYTGTATEVVIPSEYYGLPVEEIGEEAFYYCKNLTSIIIPDSVTAIGNYAFSCCENLTNVTIGNSVTTIGKGAFFDCWNLKNIKIPDSVTTIGDRTFCDCYDLTSITLSDTITTMGNSVFYSCSNLTDIYCEAESKPDGWDDNWTGYASNATIHWGYVIEDEEPELALGDIDGDEAVTTADYVFTKRAVMGTYEMTEAQIKAADIDKDSAITTADYVFVKRAVMGTYVIKG